MERLDQISKHTVIACNVKKLWFMTRKAEGTHSERVLENLWTEKTTFDEEERPTSPYEVECSGDNRTPDPEPSSKALLIARPVSRASNSRAEYRIAPRTVVEKLAGILGRIRSPEITFINNIESSHPTYADLDDNCGNGDGCDICRTPSLRKSRLGLLSLLLKALAYSGREPKHIEILEGPSSNRCWQSVGPINFPRITDFLPPTMIRSTFQNIRRFDIRSDFFNREEVALSVDKSAGDDFCQGQIGAMDTLAAMLSSAHLVEELSLRCTDSLWHTGSRPPPYLPLGTPLTGSNPLLHLRTLDLRSFRTNQPGLVTFLTSCAGTLETLVLVLVILESGSWKSAYDSLKGRFPLLEKVNLQLLYGCEEWQKEFGKIYSIFIPAGCRSLTERVIGPQEVPLRWLKDESYSLDAGNKRSMLEATQMTIIGTLEL